MKHNLLLLLLFLSFQCIAQDTLVWHRIITCNLDSVVGKSYEKPLNVYLLKDKIAVNYQIKKYQKILKKQKKYFRECTTFNCQIDISKEATKTEKKISYWEGIYRGLEIAVFADQKRRYLNENN